MLRFLFVLVHFFVSISWVGPHFLRTPWGALKLQKLLPDITIGGTNVTSPGGEAVIVCVSSFFIHSLILALLAALHGFAVQFSFRAVEGFVLRFLVPLQIEAHP